MAYSRKEAVVESLSPNSLSDIRAFEREWTVLRECICPRPDTKRLLKTFSSINWPRLLLLAEEHAVLGQLAAALNDSIACYVPLELKQSVLERQRAQNFLTLRLIGELIRVLELFAAQGIATLVIKGPVLATQAYKDPSIRSYGDLDMLVRQRDVRRATELMLASGYQAAVSPSAIDAGKVPGQYLFSKQDSSLLVELHNDRTLRYFPRPLPVEDFFARQIRVRVDGQEVPAPCVEDELVLICVHGAKHLWERLSWIADVAGLISLQTSIDWERAASSARAVQAEHLLHAGLWLAMDVLHAEPPKAIASRVRNDVVATKLAVRVLRWLPAAGYAPPGLFERAAFRLRMRGGFLAAPSYLLRLSFSPTEEDWQSGGEISDSPVLDMLRRPVRLARKYSRNSKS